MTDRSTNPAQVAVKPLEWTHDAKFCGQAMSYAETAFGTWMMVAYSGRNGRWAHTDPAGNDSDEDWAPRDECEAAAQADYEARIRSALLPAPSPEEQEPVAWTGSGSLMALKDGREGFIWPQSADAHPIPLYAHPAPVPAVPDDVAKQVYELQHGGCRAHLTAAWGAMDKAADTIEAQAAELARMRGFAEFVTRWAVSFRTSDRDDTVWTTDQWRELRRQIAALTQPTGGSND